MIFGLINKDSGPGFHRIIVPLLNMPDEDVYITNNVKEEDFEKKKPKAIYYNRLIGDDILKLQSKYQFKIVVDIDDYWELGPDHILYQYHYENRVNEHQIKHFRIADIVTTTHERLAEKIYPYNKNVVVLPNSIPKNNPYFPVVKTTSRYKRVFWQGSVTHEKDIALLANPVKRLDKNKFMMVMAGYMQGEDIWDRMVSMYTNGLKLNGSILQGLPPHLYYSNYQYADVCVCPLVENQFNSFKSNLKILEAAHSCLPVIASHVHPYLNMPGVMYVHNSRHWFNWINAPKDLHEIYAKELKSFVDKYYNFDEINLKRKECFV